MAGHHRTLRNRRDFRKLYSEGRAFHGENLVMIVRRTGEVPGRPAFVASRRVGSAVRRNRARRVLREAFRTLGVDIRSEDIHIAFVARASCARLKMQDVREDMKRLLIAADILKAGKEKKRDPDQAEGNE
jgi:ribonuclease P protein component